jgi:hypothetical protein
VCPRYAVHAPHASIPGPKSTTATPTRKTGRRSTPWTSLPNGWTGLGARTRSTAATTAKPAPPPRQSTEGRISRDSALAPKARPRPATRMPTTTGALALCGGNAVRVIGLHDHAN